MNTRIVPSAIAENRMIEKKCYYKPEFVALEKGAALAPRMANGLPGRGDP